MSTPDVIVEGMVEGGITRMMWLYADVSKMPKIGPTRSARHDFVEIAAGLNAIYAHWGGSGQASGLYAYGALSKYNIDFMTVSGHKFHAPKGIGFVYIKNNKYILPIISGGGQEYSFRAGTENLPYIKAITYCFCKYNNKKCRRRGCAHYAAHRLRLIRHVALVGDKHGALRKILVTCVACLRPHRWHRA
jgi:hypothetical protein